MMGFEELEFRFRQDKKEQMADPEAFLTGLKQVTLAVFIENRRIPLLKNDVQFTD